MLKLEELGLQELTTRFDEQDSALWCRMQPVPRPVCTENVLVDLYNVVSGLRASGGQILRNGSEKRVHNFVLTSNVPGIFNLGGDLAMFKRLIQAQDSDGLLRYARLCIDPVWVSLQNCFADVNMIALVQGQAMGGGFEMALAHDVIIAERSARFGLPEVLFNLFPGMGALSVLTRKIGTRAAEDMIQSGILYSADQLVEMGVIDLAVDDGEGERAVHEWILRTSRSGKSRQLIRRAKRHVNPLTFEELVGVTEVWVEGALSLSLRDLRIMDRLISAQNRLGSRVAEKPDMRAAA